MDEFGGIMSNGVNAMALVFGSRVILAERFSRKPAVSF